MFHRFQLILCLLIAQMIAQAIPALASATQTVPPRRPQPPFQVSAQCETFLKSLPEDVIYQWVQVPEDYSRPLGKSIFVFYYAYHLQDHPQSAPIAFFNGGPGGVSHGLVPRYLAAKPQFKKSSWVFIDQRGLGCSSPLPAQEFTRRGVAHTALYGARSIVYDAEKIRRQLLQDRPWRIFGQSWGAFIVFRYLELAPQRILAAFAHGHSIMRDGITWTEMRARAFKRVGDEYFKVHPEDRALIKRAQLLFPKNYCMSSPEYRICGAALLDDLGWDHLSSKEFGGWNRLHQSIQKLITPTGELNMAFIRERFPEKIASQPRTLLIDVAPGREGPGGFCNTWSCELAIPRMEARGERPMEYEFNECRNMLAVERTFDYRIIREVVEEDYVSTLKILRNLHHYPKIPFYLYSGALDTFGPQETFQEFVRLAGKRIRYRAYGSGHGGYFEESQTWADIASTQPNPQSNPQSSRQ
jgi:pimeloyl-ACP methyl ester carboxylesterase